MKVSVWINTMIVIIHQGGCGIIHHHPHHPYGAMGLMTGNPTMLDGGREARVSRYREKRRTRLFSKKIRYEVRKLNAEKRPRMKGRFVKRSSSSGFPLLSK
ncbi:putative transcription factor C2C2-CO-like family [Helianthus annuus]|nr:putative transcription factor C2C2-CO-like family [Helianthus annuus]